MNKSIEAIFGVPEEVPVVDLFLGDNGPQWGQLTITDGKFELEIYLAAEMSSFRIDADELSHVLRLARARLEQAH